MASTVLNVEEARCAVIITGNGALRANGALKTLATPPRLTRTQPPNARRTDMRSLAQMKREAALEGVSLHALAKETMDATYLKHYDDDFDHRPFELAKMSHVCDYCGSRGEAGSDCCGKLRREA